MILCTFYRDSGLDWWTFFLQMVHSPAFNSFKYFLSNLGFILLWCEVKSQKSFFHQVNVVNHLHHLGYLVHSFKPLLSELVSEVGLALASSGSGGRHTVQYIQPLALAAIFLVQLTDWDLIISNLLLFYIWTMDHHLSRISYSRGYYCGTWQ